MQPPKGNPAALAARTGLPVADLAGGSIDRKNNTDRPISQAAAKQLARSVFSKPPTGIIAAIGNNGLPYWRPR